MAGVTTRQLAFLEAYEQAVSAFAERFKQQEDPPDPRDRFSISHFDYARMEEMGPEWEEEILSIKRLNPAWSDTLLWIEEINQRYKLQLVAWFKLHGYTSDFVPAPQLDHRTPRKLKTWENPDNHLLFGQVTQVGQVVITSFQHRGERYYDLVVASSGLSFGLRGLSCAGNQETKQIYHKQLCHLASRLSELTDWSQFHTFSAREKRSLHERVSEISREVVGEK